MKSFALFTIIFALVAATAYSKTCGAYSYCATCDSSNLYCTSCLSGYSLFLSTSCVDSSTASTASSVVSSGVALATWLLVVVIVVPIVIVLICVIGIICCVMQARRKRKVIQTNVVQNPTMMNSTNQTMMNQTTQPIYAQQQPTYGQQPMYGQAPVYQ